MKDPHHISATPPNFEGTANPEVQLVRKLDVFTVSVGSLVFIIFLTICITASALITNLSNGELIGLLIGQEPSATLLEVSQSEFNSTADAVLSNDLLGRSVVFGLWMLVGLLVFVAINVISKAIGDVKEIETEIQSEIVDRKVLLTGIARDALFRLGIAVLWSGFMVISLQYILPFFVAALYVYIGPFGGMLDGLITALAMLVVLVSLHLHVVLARLVVGRIRLFGI